MKVQRFVAYCFNFLQFTLGPGALLWFLIKDGRDSFSLAHTVILNMAFYLLVLEFFTLFLYHLLSDDNWMKRRVPVVEYFKMQENLFFLKSLGLGVVSAILTFVIAMFI